MLVALGSPDAAYDGDVPTKVFEYLDARRPILAIASPARDKPFSADELNALVRNSCQLHRGSDDDDGAG